METQDNKEQFRDSISTVSKQGKRVWIYPKKPSGRFYTARTVFSLFLIAFLVIIPFIKISGRPLVLLNVLERKFILFGLAFGPHDFYLFVLAFIALIVFVVLFTAIYGRVFCGWACPQTVFMEMVFRKIEYVIEGDANKQRALDAQPWDGEKFLKRGGKLVVFYFLSFLVANLLLSFIIGVDDLWKIINEPVAKHVWGFVSINVFTALFFFVFSYFREQACTIVCPYGRLQGVLLDKNSLVVAYDDVRGEPRGKMKKGEERTNGDCIDCHLCVDVCPTGIDIRNGIQLECVNCTACIDACDDVMDKIKKPRGLVRYDSLNGIKDRIRFKITPRIIVYSIILTLLLSIFTYLLATRTDFNVNILRTPGMLYQDQPNDMISNIYTINVVNKTFNDVQIAFKVKNMPAEIKILGEPVNLKGQAVYEGRFMIVLDRKKLDKMNVPLYVGVYQNGKEIKTVKTSFLSHSD
ncbi:MAG: cytochrome c oxidase accessory protein CcoG [Ignavibacteriales bacterium]|nr:cytochrome c oxidase accessory protein CcoG [Ignavibacteriales bacterium]